MRKSSAGVTVMAGSDAGPFDSYVYPGSSLHAELAALVEAGLSPLEALAAATIAPARFLGVDDRVGRVAVGYVADLLLLGGEGGWAPGTPVAPPGTVARARGAPDLAPMPHVHPPKQARSRRTLDRMVRAALELIDERGVEATGVHDIVERAGSSVGSFYARFESKEDLLLYLEEQLWTDAGDRWAAALDERDWQGLGLDELVGAIVRVLVEAYRVDARQRRVLDARRGGPEPDGPGARFHARLRRDLRSLLLEHQGRIAHPDPAGAVDFALGALVGAIREARESAEPTPDERLVSELTRMVLAYLGEPPAGDGPTGAVEFFEIWE